MCSGRRPSSDHSVRAISAPFKRPAIITRGGTPVAAVVPIDADALDDWILANAPAFVEGIRRADEDLRRGLTVGMDKAMLGAAAKAGRSAKRKAKVSRR